MTKYSLIYDYISSLNDEEMIELHNDYCRYMHYYEDAVYYMDELDEQYNPALNNDSATKAYHVLELVNMSDNYFCWHLDYLKSFNTYEDAPVRMSLREITNYIYNNANDLGNPTIREILEDLWNLEEFLNSNDLNLVRLPSGETKTGEEWLEKLSNNPRDLNEVISFDVVYENGEEINVVKPMTKEELTVYVYVS